MITYTTHRILSTNKHAKVPQHGFLAQKLNGRSEPLIQEADPHITKLAIEAQIEDKDDPKK